MLKRLLIAILLLLALAVAGFVIWGSTPLGPAPEAMSALHSDNKIDVQVLRGWSVFHLHGSDPRTGLIIYPGGRVDYRSYAPLARRISQAGYLVVLVPMPLNLAVFGVNKADDVIANFPQVLNWAIGGHSLGGAMAASYAYNHPGKVDGLVLWAAYPAENNSLAGQDIKVVSIYGTRDGLATQDKIDASRPLLPADTIWVLIEGGNHTQFGAYGSQPGDQSASIDSESQLDQAVSGAITLLKDISKGE
jgi:hypothetical protein